MNNYKYFRCVLALVLLITMLFPTSMLVYADDDTTEDTGVAAVEAVDSDSYELEGAGDTEVEQSALPMNGECSSSQEGEECVDQLSSTEEDTGLQDGESTTTDEPETEILESAADDGSFDTETETMTDLGEAGEVADELEQSEAEDVDIGETPAAEGEEVSNVLPEALEVPQETGDEVVEAQESSLTDETASTPIVVMDTEGEIVGVIDEAGDVVTLESEEAAEILKVVCGKVCKWLKWGTDLQSE